MPDLMPPAVQKFVADASQAMAEIRLLGESFVQLAETTKVSTTEMSTAMVSAGERIAAESQAISVENERMAASFQTTASATARANEEMVASTETMTEAEKRAQAEWTAACEKMAADTEALAAKVQQAEAEAAASTEAMAAKIDAAAAEQSAAWGKFATGVVIGAAVAGAATVKMAGDFQSEMMLVRTNAHDSTDSIDDMSKAVLDMASQTGQAPEKLAEGLYHIVSSGQRGKEALDILAASAKDATIGMADLDSVTYAMSGVMSVGMSDIKDAADGVALLNTIVGQGDMRMQDLANAIGTGVLPVFKNAGLGAVDFGAALATLTDNSTPAEVAANHLKTSIMLLQNQSGPAIKALGDLGIKQGELGADISKPGGLLLAINDIKSHMEDYTKTNKTAALSQDDVSKAVSDMSDQLTTEGVSVDEQKGLLEQYKGSLENMGSAGVQAASDLAKAFGGARSAMTIETLVQESDKLASKYQEMGDSASREAQSQKDWNDAQSTFNVKMQDAKAGVEALSIRVGTYLLPVVSRIAGVFSDATHFIGSNDAAAKTLAITIGTVLVAALVAGVSKLLTWVTNLDGAAGKIVGMTGKLALMTAAFDYGFTHIDSFTGVLSLVVGGITAASTAVDLFKGPIKSVIDGLGNTKAAFSNFVSDVGNAEGAMGKITTAGKGVMGFLTGPWGVAIGLAVGALALLTGGSKDSSKAVDDLTKAIEDDAGTLGTNTRAWTAHKLETDGALDTAKKLGISEGDLTTSILTQGTAVDGLKQKLQDLIKAHTTMNYVNEGGRGNASHMVASLDDTGKAAQGLLGEVNNLSGSLQDSQKAALQEAQAAHQTTGALGDTAKASMDTAKTADDLVAASTDAATALAAQKKEAKLLTDQLDLLNGGHIDAEKGLIKFRDSVDTATQALSDNKKNLDDNTAAGRKDISAILDAVQAAHDHAAAVAQQTGNVQDGTKAFGDDIEALKKTLLQSGLTKAEVDKLAAAYMQIPHDLTTNVSVNVNSAFTALGKLDSHINSTFNALKGLGGAKEGGLIGHYATGGVARFGPGGPVTGGGSDTSDSIPAMLSMSEFVEPASAVRSAGVDVMEALRGSELKKAYGLLGQRIGVPAGPQVIAAGGGGVVIHVHVGALLSTKRDVVKAVQEAILPHNLRNTSNGLSVTGA